MTSERVKIPTIIYHFIMPCPVAHRNSMIRTTAKKISFNSALLMACLDNWLKYQNQQGSTVHS